jgi:hypothetical protein
MTVVARDIAGGWQDDRGSTTHSRRTDESERT